MSYFSVRLIYIVVELVRIVVILIIGLEEYKFRSGSNCCPSENEEIKLYDIPLLNFSKKFQSHTCMLTLVQNCSSILISCSIVSIFDAAKSCCGT